MSKGDTYSKWASIEQERELNYLVIQHIAARGEKEIAETLTNNFSKAGRLPTRIGFDGIEYLLTRKELDRRCGHIPVNFLQKLINKQIQMRMEQLSPSLPRVAGLLALGGSNLVPKIMEHPHPAEQYRKSKTRPSIIGAIRNRQCKGRMDTRRKIKSMAFKQYREVKRVLGHLHPIYCVTYTKCGTKIYTGADDGLIKVWGALNGRLLKTFRRHKAEVTDICLHPNEKILCSSSNDATIRLWDTETRATIVILQEHVMEVMRVKFTPKGDRIVSISLDGTTKVWNTERVHEPPLNIVASKRGGTARQRAQCSVMDLHWSGTEVVVGTSDHSARIFSLVADYKQYWPGTSGDAFSRNEWRERTAMKEHTNLESWVVHDDDHYRQHIFSSRHKPEGAEMLLSMLDGHQAEVTGVGYSHGGHRVFTASAEDGRIRVWVRPDRLTRAKLRRRYVCYGQINCHQEGMDTLLGEVAWSLDDRLLMACEGNNLKIYDSMSVTLLHNLGAYQQHTGMLCLRPHPSIENLVLTTGTGGNVVVWDCVRGRVVKTWRTGSAINDVQFSKNGQHICAVTNKGQILFFGTGSRERYFEAPEDQFFERDYLKVEYNPDGVVVDHETGHLTHLLPNGLLMDRKRNVYVNQPRSHFLRAKCKSIGPPPQPPRPQLGSGVTTVAPGLVKEYAEKLSQYQKQVSDRSRQLDDYLAKHIQALRREQRRGEDSDSEEDRRNEPKYDNMTPVQERLTLTQIRYPVHRLLPVDQQPTADEQPAADPAAAAAGGGGQSSEAEGGLAVSAASATAGSGGSNNGTALTTPGQMMQQQPQPRESKHPHQEGDVRLRLIMTENASSNGQAMPRLEPVPNRPSPASAATDGGGGGGGGRGHGSSSVSSTRTAAGSTVVRRRTNTNNYSNNIAGVSSSSYNNNGANPHSTRRRPLTNAADYKENDDDGDEEYVYEEEEEEDDDDDDDDEDYAPSPRTRQARPARSSQRCAARSSSSGREGGGGGGQHGRRLGGFGDDDDGGQAQYASRRQQQHQEHHQLSSLSSSSSSLLAHNGNNLNNIRDSFAHPATNGGHPIVVSGGGGGSSNSSSSSSRRSSGRRDRKAAASAADGRGGLPRAKRAKVSEEPSSSNATGSTKRAKQEGGWEEDDDQGGELVLDTNPAFHLDAAPNPKLPQLQEQDFKWLQATAYDPVNVLPQLGDELVYFHQGHRAALEDQGDVFGEDAAPPPWEQVKNLAPEITGIVTRIEYHRNRSPVGDAQPRAYCRLTLRLTSHASKFRVRKGKHPVRSIVVDYHKLEAADYVVLKSRVEHSRKWRPGHRAKMYFQGEENPYTGEIIDIRPVDKNYANSAWDNCQVLWDPEPLQEYKDGNITKTKRISSRANKGKTLARFEPGRDNDRGRKRKRDDADDDDDDNDNGTKRAAKMHKGGGGKASSVAAAAADRKSEGGDVKEKEPEVTTVCAWELIPLENKLCYHPPVLPAHLQKAVSEMAKQLIESDAEMWFHYPVSLEAYPDYTLAVTVPICLATIQERAANRFYRTLAAVRFDLNLLVSNCKRYNQPGSEVVRKAEQLRDAAMEMLLKAETPAVGGGGGGEGERKVVDRGMDGGENKIASVAQNSGSSSSTATTTTTTTTTTKTSSQHQHHQHHSSPSYEESGKENNGASNNTTASSNNHRLVLTLGEGGKYRKISLSSGSGSGSGRNINTGNNNSGGDSSARNVAAGALTTSRQNLPHHHPADNNNG